MGEIDFKAVNADINYYAARRDAICVGIVAPMSKMEHMLSTEEGTRILSAVRELGTPYIRMRTYEKYSYNWQDAQDLIELATFGKLNNDGSVTKKGCSYWFCSFEGDNFTAYLRTCIEKAFLDMGRYNSYRRASSIDEIDYGHEARQGISAYEESSRAEHLEYLMAELSKALEEIGIKGGVPRRMFEMYYFDGKSQVEIAGEFNRSHTVVSRDIKMVRDKLSEDLELRSLFKDLGVQAAISL